MRVIFLQRLNKLHYFLFYQFLVVRTVNVIHTGINGENLNALLPVDPLLVSFVDRSNVLQTDVFLALSVPDLDSLQTDFRGTLQVDNALDGAVLDERMADGVVDFVLMGLKVAVLVHDFAKDVPVGEGGSFREEELVVLLFDGLFPEEGPGMEGIELEGESPSFGIGVVFFEDVDASDVLPEIDWFFDGLDIEETEES
jgi:hypothetical protein